MPRTIDETHDPKLKSWVESANDPASDFPIQNLPLVAFVESDSEDPEWESRTGVRIGDQILDLRAVAERKLLTQAMPDSSEIEMLEILFEVGAEAPFSDVSEFPKGSLEQLRRALQSVLRAENQREAEERNAATPLLIPVAETLLGVPVAVGNYTDFYASIHHATNVGSMFRPDNPILPNYKWVPIGYHGRASSIVPSGMEIRRPSGQTKADEADAPRYGPCRLLDYELEVGFVVSRGNELGSPIPLAAAEDHLLGICLVNDWSARDMQKWEYQPLGPFLAKSFATTMSPYIVTMEALAPFRCPVYKRPDGDPRPLPYLLDEHNESAGGIDLTLEVHLASAEMRKRGMAPHRLSKGSFRDMYWTIAQMLTHHSSNGCNMQPGDLLASGTVSGVAPDARGCLLELTWDGAGKPRKPIELPTGEKRVFLEDGDEVIMTGYCQRDGFRRIGLGECRGIVAPALTH